jgi:serine/threonine protein kinase
MTAPPTPTCPRCGTAVTAGARACSNCGADVSGQQGQAATAYASPSDATRIGVSQGGIIDALRRATVGDYEIKGELGHGGMASVFLAHELALDRKVAIKVMSPALFSTAGMVERFKREARTSASLSHPHIIPIFAVRESPEIVYFVMKFIEGRSLESIVHQLGQMPIPLVQAILYQVGSALGYAHRRGVVHRDVKPANIMIDSDGWSVVTDFGIAKVAESKGLTQTGATIGTPSYMSPEQCAAKTELTGASDQYSLGVVAYEMLAGQLPFQAETTVGLLFAHVHETPPSIADIRPDIPEDVADAVMRMLAKEPEERWPDIETAVGALGGAPIAHDDPIRAQLVELAGGRSQSPAETIRTPMSPVPANKLSPPPATRTATPKERRPATRTGTSVPSGSRAPAPPAAKRRSALVYIAPLVLLAAGAAWWILGRSPTAAPSASPPLAAVETVRVAEPETVRMATPAPAAAHTDTTKPAGTTTHPTPAASNPAPSGTSRAESQAFKIAEAQALAVRLRAVSAGATKDSLAGGDVDASAADVLAQSGHYSEARAKLATAVSEWTAAGTAAANAARRTDGGGFRRGGGERGGLQTEAQQVAAEFADAFSNKSLARIRVVYPRITEQQAQEWGDLFLKASNMTMQLNVNGLNRVGPFEASATLEGAYDYTEIQSGAAGHQPVSWQATMRITPSGWKIIALR